MGKKILRILGTAGMAALAVTGVASATSCRTEEPVVVQKYTVTFNSNGGSSVSAVEVEAKAKVAKPTNPTKDGFTFEGWFTDEALTTAYSFDSEVTANLTLYAKWEAVAPVQTASLVLDTESVQKEFVQYKETFNSNNLVVKVKEGDTETAVTGFVVDSSEFNNEAVGEYTIEVVYLHGTTALSATYKVTVVEGAAKVISTAEDFVNMRKTANAEGYNVNDYILANDIDLAGVTLDAAGDLTFSSVTFKGVFDGNGHTIKNASFTQTGSKQGLMFDKLEGATIKNVKFFGCAVKGGAAETVGIIAG